MTCGWDSSTRKVKGVIPFVEGSAWGRCKLGWKSPRLDLNYFAIVL